MTGVFLFLGLAAALTVWLRTAGGIPASPAGNFAALVTAVVVAGLLAGGIGAYLRGGRR